jgi:hypothetical protein
MSARGNDDARRQLRLRRLDVIDREERALAERAAKGDRAAFDRLFDRYFARVSHALRDLPEPEAKARISRALTRVFDELEAPDGSSLLARAFRVTCAVRQRRASVGVTPSARGRASVTPPI